MSYMTVFCVAAAEALSLTLVWIALRVSMSRVVRPLLACSGLSVAWGAWILVLVLRGPVAMMALTGFVLAVGSVAMGFAIYLATIAEEDRRDGGTGGAPTVIPEGPGGGGNDEPMWWPQFQRELAAYAARDRERELVDS